MRWLALAFVVGCRGEKAAPAPVARDAPLADAAIDAAPALDASIDASVDAGITMKPIDALKFGPALLLSFDGAYVIDLGTVEPTHARVMAAVRAVTAKINAKPQPFQVWVLPTRILNIYVGEAEKFGELSDALYAATKKVSPAAMIEDDAPAAPVYLLRSLGFEAYLPPVELTTTKGGNINVVDEVEKARSLAPRKLVKAK
jgi:hypothetical protein